LDLGTGTALLRDLSSPFTLLVFVSKDGSLWDGSEFEVDLAIDMEI
jgi:hypothetical protein